LDTFYRCEVNTDPNIITEESAVISGVSGTHEGSKNDDDVQGFYATGKTIQFFPKGLENIFKNIKVIRITECQLKAIHQSDLKPFPNLVYFFSAENEIKVIEKGLFDYNPDLEVVGFAYETEIAHIDPNVFDNLNKLRYFFFWAVPCVSQTISDSREEVQKIIQVVKSNCSNSEYL